MKISTKGQITIPQDIREQAGVGPGDEMDFVFEDGTIKLVRSKGTKTRGQRLVEHMWGRATVRMTTDEIMALTRGED
jgi:AbrB family looped-hinge helix DNA binding protein